MTLKNTIEKLLEKLIVSQSVTEIDQIRGKVNKLLHGKIKVKKLEKWNYFVDIKLYEIKENLNLFSGIYLISLTDDL